MVTFGEKFRALLATGRMANLPTVWSNVLVGFWLASALNSSYLSTLSGINLRLVFLGFILIVASCIYVGGCFLGDARDIHFDKKNRPNRPLPQGILSVSLVSFLAWGLFALASLVTLTYLLPSIYISMGYSLTELFGSIGAKDIKDILQLHELAVFLIMIVCVITYAFIHKKSKPVGLLLMSSCRLLLVIFAASCAYKTMFSYEQSHGLTPPYFLQGWLEPWLMVFAGTVGAYTLLLSWVASTESTPGQFPFRKLLATCMITLPVASYFANTLFFKSIWAISEYWESDPFEAAAEPIFIGMAHPPSFGVHYVALAACMAWIIFALYGLKKSKPVFVSRALAGFCLLDACFVAAYSPTIALVCIGLFCVALLLQKIAPAT